MKIKSKKINLKNTKKNEKEIMLCSIRRECFNPSKRERYIRTSNKKCKSYNVINCQLNKIRLQHGSLTWKRTSSR